MDDIAAGLPALVYWYGGVESVHSIGQRPGRGNSNEGMIQQTVLRLQSTLPELISGFQNREIPTNPTDSA
ncbi:hypothetical protein KOW79_002540 [Hemibagrus wyckioides]|uniref:Uncharacterized protein n=1 Tax=Hemibagrus wyckioides TaxID=337641 RepID=A0A9D3P3S8_9TELE|nr:hypothetical protein KOW79_002540 [Hemibagrus wyckioides]